MVGIGVAEADPAVQVTRALVACVDLFVFASETQAILMCRLDNLGKGASGAAVQSMNVHLGLDEATGLV